MYLDNQFAPACVPQAVAVSIRIVCYNIRLWDTSEGVVNKIIILNFVQAWTLARDTHWCKHPRLHQNNLNSYKFYLQNEVI
ncbi:MAG: hypothetical protein EAZ85_05265 [Bacteroidetes bacterium]|nr:MAG: hypothetical protein EAZ85_05265 [Bacteroidota bacterium]TAG86906.1 MAG: hypothetical protein EAZ20_11845 [Bacteroidota bacterium]